jgi:2-keto-4-pentenoate hydratase/2-oxohepta-3-ene-1,7-dioic acid hydratase in catechol pathway
MKLFRHGQPGQERPGILIDEQHLDISAGFKEDYDGNFFSSGGIGRLSDWLSTHKNQCPVLSEGFRFAAVIASPSKIVCVGLNYTDHSKETGTALPKEPVLFFKSTTAICGPNDDIIIPRESKKTDWEVELAFVIGKKASYVKEKDAIDYVVGYILHNDYSERAFQMERGGQWVKGKSCDTFAPIGPWLVTPDEIEDVHQLRLWLKLNGKTMQDGNTSNLVFKIPFLIHYISSFMTLLPGDIISTGTPAGVGLGQKPEPFYLKPGDLVELGIDGLGSASQHLVSYKDPI